MLSTFKETLIFVQIPQKKNSLISFLFVFKGSYTKLQTYKHNSFQKQFLSERVSPQH